jgi:hypothetical protein
MDIALNGPRDAYRGKEETGIKLATYQEALKFFKSEGLIRQERNSEDPSGIYYSATGGIRKVHGLMLPGFMAAVLIGRANTDNRTISFQEMLPRWPHLLPLLYRTWDLILADEDMYFPVVVTSDLSDVDPENQRVLFWEDTAIETCREVFALWYRSIFPISEDTLKKRFYVDFIEKALFCHWKEIPEGAPSSCLKYSASRFKKDPELWVIAQDLLVKQGERCYLLLNAVKKIMREAPTPSAASPAQPGPSP